MLAACGGGTREPVVLAAVGDSLLLWFHRVRWDERMASGRTLWEELVHATARGWIPCGRCGGPGTGWPDGSIPGGTAPSRSGWRRRSGWRDASLLYFQQFARKPIPPQYERPARPLEFYTAQTSDQIPDF